MRAFIAIELPDDIKSKVNVFKRQLEKELNSGSPRNAKDALKFVEDENLHITLRFFKDITDQQAAEIKETIKSLSFEPFTIKCEDVGVFPNENYIRVIWIGIRSNGNLEKVWEELNSRLKAKFGTDRFTAHLTIARVKTRLTRSQIEKIFSHKKQEFGSFVLIPEMIVLKKSTLTPEGPIYSNL